jgi:hypothetical protein
VGNAGRRALEAYTHVRKKKKICCTLIKKKGSVLEQKEAAGEHTNLAEAVNYHAFFMW